MLKICKKKIAYEKKLWLPITGHLLSLTRVIKNHSAQELVTWISNNSTIEEGARKTGWIIYFKVHFCFIYNIYLYIYISTYLYIYLWG